MNKVLIVNYHSWLKPNNMDHVICCCIQRGFPGFRGALWTGQTHLDNGRELGLPVEQNRQRTAFRCEYTAPFPCRGHSTFQSMRESVGQHWPNLENDSQFGRDLFHQVRILIPDWSSAKRRCGDWTDTCIECRLLQKRVQWRSKLQRGLSFISWQTMFNTKRLHSNVVLFSWSLKKWILPLAKGDHSTDMTSTYLDKCSRFASKTKNDERAKRTQLHRKRKIDPHLR